MRSWCPAAAVVDAGRGRARRRRTRPPGGLHRLRGHARDRHLDHRPVAPHARSGAHPGRRLPDRRGGRRGGQRHHRGRHHPRGSGDAGRAGHRRPARPRSTPATPWTPPAALVVELDGPRVGVPTRTSAVVERICTTAGATHIRVAADPAERALIWKGRKAAFAAMGRISPDYFVQDGVIPRTRLAEVLVRIEAMAERRRPAGGERLPRRRRQPAPAGALQLRACPASPNAGSTCRRAIAELCVEMGGSITGEHGVGTDKACSMPKMFSEDDLATMMRLRTAFDPDGYVQPGQDLPHPAAVRRAARALPRAPAGGRRPDRAGVRPMTGRRPAACAPRAARLGPEAAELLRETTGSVLVRGAGTKLGLGRAGRPNPTWSSTPPG